MKKLAVYITLVLLTVVAGRQVYSIAKNGITNIYQLQDDQIVLIIEGR